MVINFLIKRTGFAFLGIKKALGNNLPRGKRPVAVGKDSKVNLASCGLGSPRGNS